MEDTFILEKRQRVIRLDDREFTMREMGAADFRSYTNKLVEMHKGVKACAQMSSDGDISALLRDASNMECALLQMVLSEPLDESKPADEDFIAGLSFSQRQAIFKAQDELNNTAELLKNLTSLLG